MALMISSMHYLDIRVTVLMKTMETLVTSA
jgi:hypothetical protein